MKPSTLFFLAASVLFTNTLNASPEPAELQEATRLTAAIEKLINEKYGPTDAYNSTIWRMNPQLP